MAIEIITDADSGTSTVGNTAVNLAGNYTSTVLGATFLWCAGFFGAYTAFTRVVTGVAIDIVSPISISIFGGYKFEAHGGPVTKFVRGKHYTWDVAEKFEQHQQKTTTATKKIEILSQLNQTIGSAIATYAQDVVVRAGGDITSVCKSHSTTCTGDIILESADTISISGEGNVSITGENNLSLISRSEVTIYAPSKVTMNGGFVNIG